MNQILNKLSPLSTGSIGHALVGDSSFLGGGLDSVTPEEGYRWNGLRRDGERDRKAWLFQYTISGQGVFQNEKTTRVVGEGEAFCATIPSMHQYQSVHDCPQWTFFWLMTNDAMVTNRLLRHPNLNNEILALAPTSPVVHTAMMLLQQLFRSDLMDRYQLEEYLFRWMFECERWADEQLYPAGPKVQLLEFARKFTLARLDQQFSTLELAQAYGTTRSNFSHHFKKTTGRTPAAFVAEVRLEEAGQLLRTGNLSVKETAARTGFTDSNHLCKSFFRRFQMSPGNYRSLHRRPPPPGGSDGV